MLLADVNRNENLVQYFPIEILAPSRDRSVVVAACAPPTAPLTRSAKASRKCAAGTRAMCTQPSGDSTMLTAVGRWLRVYAHGMSGP
jgi:hypothetical protein